MKFTVDGFSQQRLIELGLDITDSALLRFFVDFKDTGKMVREIIDGEPYYWFKYDHVLNEMPILGIKKDTLYRRLKKMAEVGVLKHKTVKRAGTYSYYTTGEEYCSLIIKQDLSDSNPTGYGNKSERVRNEIREGTDLNPEQNINLQEDKSIKDSSIKDNTACEDKPRICKKSEIDNSLVENIWSLYPRKQGKSDAVKKIPKLIDKYGYDQIIRCVERYKDYTSSNRIEMKYIKHGSTFFNGTYQDYLDDNFNIGVEAIAPTTNNWRF